MSHSFPQTGAGLDNSRKTKSTLKQIFKNKNDSARRYNAKKEKKNWWRIHPLEMFGDVNEISSLYYGCVTDVDMFYMLWWLIWWLLYPHAIRESRRLTRISRHTKWQSRCQQRCRMTRRHSVSCNDCTPVETPWQLPLSLVLPAIH